jgi:hypothetical protein
MNDQGTLDNYDRQSTYSIVHAHTKIHKVHPWDTTILTIWFSKAFEGCKI